MAAFAAERESAIAVAANSMSTGERGDRGRNGGGKEVLREMTNCISTDGGTSGPTRSTQRTRSSSRSTGYVMTEEPMNPGLG